MNQRTASTAVGALMGAALLHLLSAACSGAGSSGAVDPTPSAMASGGNGPTGGGTTPGAACTSWQIVVLPIDYLPGAGAIPINVGTGTPASRPIRTLPDGWEPFAVSGQSSDQVSARRCSQ